MRITDGVHLLLNISAGKRSIIYKKSAHVCRGDGE